MRILTKSPEICICSQVNGNEQARSSGVDIVAGVAVADRSLNSLFGTRAQANRIILLLLGNLTSNARSESLEIPPKCVAKATHPEVHPDFRLVSKRERAIERTRDELADFFATSHDSSVRDLLLFVKPALLHAVG